jgi:hypothetical protein
VQTFQLLDLVPLITITINGITIVGDFIIEEGGSYERTSSDAFINLDFSTGSKMTVNGTYIHNYNGGTISEILAGVIIHFA